MYKEEKFDRMKKGLKDKYDKGKETVNTTIEWCNENKEFLALTIPVVILGIKKIDKHMSIAKEARLKDSYIYDRSMGMYLEATKPLTTAQKLDIDAMHKSRHVLC